MYVYVVPLRMCISDGIYCIPFSSDTTCAKLSWPAMAEEAAEQRKAPVLGTVLAEVCRWVARSLVIDCLRRFDSAHAKGRDLVV